MPQEIDFTPPERTEIRRGEPVPPPKVILRGMFDAPPSLDGMKRERFVREPYRGRP